MLNDAVVINKEANYKNKFSNFQTKHLRKDYRFKTEESDAFNGQSVLRITQKFFEFVMRTLNIMLNFKI